MNCLLNFVPTEVILRWVAKNSRV